MWLGELKIVSKSVRQYLIPGTNDLGVSISQPDEYHCEMLIEESAYLA